MANCDKADGDQSALGGGAVHLPPWALQPGLPGYDACISANSAYLPSYVKSGLDASQVAAVIASKSKYKTSIFGEGKIGLNYTFTPHELIHFLKMVHEENFVDFPSFIYYRDLSRYGDPWDLCGTLQPAPTLMDGLKWYFYTRKSALSVPDRNKTRVGLWVVTEMENVRPHYVDASAALLIGQDYGLGGLEEVIGVETKSIYFWDDASNPKKIQSGWNRVEYTLPHAQNCGDVQIFLYEVELLPDC